MKIIPLLTLTTISILLPACTTSTVGHNVVNENGEYTNEQLDWPTVKEPSKIEGSFPNLANLGQVAAGLTKKELYRLIGRPHFQEISHAREWNYLMKFRQLDHGIKYCQYKVLFDQDEIAQNFYWLPEDCLQVIPTHL